MNAKFLIQSLYLTYDEKFYSYQKRFENNLMLRSYADFKLVSIHHWKHLKKLSYENYLPSMKTIYNFCLNHYCKPVGTATLKKIGTFV